MIIKNPKNSATIDVKTSITKTLSESFLLEYNFSLPQRGRHDPFIKANWSLQFTCTTSVAFKLLLNEGTVSDQKNII